MAGTTEPAPAQKPEKGALDDREVVILEKPDWIAAISVPRRARRKADDAAS